MSGRAPRWWRSCAACEPALEESEITRERLALEEAIRKVEAEAARQAREAPRPPPPPSKRPEPPKRPDAAAAEAARSRRGVRASTPDARSRDAKSQDARSRSATTSGATKPDATSSGASRRGANRVRRRRPIARPRRARSATPPSDPNLSLSDQAMRGFREVASDPNATAAAKAERTAFTPTFSPPPPPPPTPPPASTITISSSRKTTRGRRRRTIIGPRRCRRSRSTSTSSAPASGRPRPPRTPEPDEVVERPPPRRQRTPGRYKGLIRIAIVLAIIGVVAGLGWWQRDTITNAATGIMAMVRGNGTPAPRDTPARRTAEDHRPHRTAGHLAAGRAARWRSASCSTKKTPTIRKASG